MMGHVLVTSDPTYNCSWTLSLFVDIINLCVNFIIASWTLLIVNINPNCGHVCVTSDQIVSWTLVMVHINLNYGYVPIV